jgi:hypothetical protein
MPDEDEWGHVEAAHRTVNKQAEAEKKIGCDRKRTHANVKKHAKHEEVIVSTLGAATASATAPSSACQRRDGAHARFEDCRAQTGVKVREWSHPTHWQTSGRARAMA